jgi:magnesium chelatase family protein
LSRAISAALLGVDGVAIEVEVRISSQLPRIDIVGLPEAAVRESAARVRAAVGSIGLRFPDRRVTVDLAPAELRKTGAGLDLPIAAAVLAAAGQLEGAALSKVGLVGELPLDGRLRPVRGALALALAVRQAGGRELIVPAANAAEAALAPGLTVWRAESLAAVVAHLLGTGALQRQRPTQPVPAAAPALDLADVRGQEHAKRALEVAVAGGHGLLLRGAPGAGKTMLARRLADLLPPLEREEALVVTKIHGALAPLETPIITERPFRAPHHTASPAGLLGGGSPPRPGEVSLAHGGVLFLDELPEFDRRCLESLRQVLEEGRVVVARASATCVFPAAFQLAAAANPCPCGWRESGRRDCRCDDGAVARDLARVSGPLLDRIDLHVAVRPVEWRALDAGATPGTTSAEARARVVAARRLARRRGLPSNARIPDGSLDDQVAATPEARRLLGRAVDRFALSARGARRVLRVARTIADLAGEARTGPRAVGEALSYRTEATP